HQPSVGGRETTPEAGGRLESKRVRQHHEVHVGPRHHHVLGEAAPAVEAGLVLALTQVLVARPALATVTTAAAERGGDSLAAGEPPDARPDGPHDAGELVTGHVWEGHRGIVTHPGMPIT